MAETLLMEIDATAIRGIEQVPEEQWVFYDDVLAAVGKTGQPFAIGGALAWAAYCGYYRNSKDLDLYVPVESKQKFIDAVTSIGAQDYYDIRAYDRGWIYRSTRDDCIADLIWAMANYVRPIDPDYFNGKTQLSLRGNTYAVLPAEELILNKLYILARTRCDWFDVFNILYVTRGELDWERLVRKMGEDKVLFASALSVFCWLCPARVNLFPSHLWTILNLPVPPAGDEDVNERRMASLDSRPWFVPMLKPGELPFTEPN